MFDVLHDNHVLGYEVDVRAARITFRTESDYAGGPKEHDAVFEGVLAYFFQDGLGGILLSIDERPFDEVLRRYAEMFERGSRDGWPWISELEPAAHVARNEGRAFLITGSIGFDGFVIAKSARVESS